jgi:hypothetical protein
MIPKKKKKTKEPIFRRIKENQMVYCLQAAALRRVVGSNIGEVSIQLSIIKV